MESSPSLSRSIKFRLPDRPEMVQVFGAVLFAVFGWSIRGFFYKIPAFALYFGLATNLAVLSYMLAFALIESLLVAGLLTALALFVRPLREGFAYKGFLIVLVASIAMIVFESYYRFGFAKDILAGNYSSIPPFAIGLIATMLVLSGALWLFRVNARLQKIARAVAEQFSLFTYIYVPLGLIGLVVVIVRNLV